MIIYYPNSASIVTRNTSTGNMVMEIINVPPTNAVFYFDTTASFSSSSVVFDSASYAVSSSVAISSSYAVSASTSGFTGQLRDSNTQLIAQVVNGIIVASLGTWNGN